MSRIPPSAVTRTGAPTHSLPTGRRRLLSDLLTAESSWTPKPELLHAALAGGQDQLLYHAYRDILPSRHDHDDGSTEGWFADLVVYQPGQLSNSEPVRSVGHWNALGQMEIFQTLTGRTLFLTASRTARGGHCIRQQTCASGEVAVVPFGGWHLTYALDGPAAVVNIYADRPGAGGHSSRDAATAPEVKYSAARPSPQIAVTREDHGHLRFVGADAMGTRVRQAPTADWLRPIIDSYDQSLTSLFLTTTPQQLATLMHTAWDHQ